MKKQVSIRAVKARLSRHLKTNGEYLRSTRNGYLVIDQQNTITSTSSDIAQLAKDCGVLMGYEEIKQ